MKRRLVAFPNDPIRAYYEKGEIKPRYYNPCNLFNEVHLITPADRDVQPGDVQALAGEARLFIHPLGRPDPIRLPCLLSRASQLVSELEPAVIRGHGVLLGGLQAVSSGRRNGIPVVISVHSNPDEDFAVWLKQGRIPLRLSSIRQYLWYRLFQGHILHSADRVVCAYRFAERYARRHGARDTVVIYNRVDTDRFVPVETRQRRKRPLVLNVNQQIEVKNPEPLLRAVADLPVDLLLIGDGVLHERLRRVARSLGLDERVTFIKAIPHAEIHWHYQHADIFANPMQCGGVAIGTIEAMACGLPVVHARPLWEEEPEVLGDLGIVVEPTPEGFRSGIQYLLDNPAVGRELGRRGRERIEGMNGQLMEQRERELYQDLVRAH